MRAVVLVGGEGTRLRPLTYTTPKQLLPIVEVAMIERVVAVLARHGIDDVVLSLGYRPDAFLGAYPDGVIDAPDGVGSAVRLRYAVEPEPLDTAGAVAFAARQAGIDETFVVVNGDVLTDVDVTALVAFHRARRAQATIHLTPVDDPSRFGVVATDGTGRVTAFVEKPRREEAPTNLINAGTYVFEPGVLDRIPPDRRVSVERETFPALVSDGALFAMASDAYWLDTGTPQSLLQAQMDLLEGRRGALPAPGARRVDDGVWVLGDAEIAGEVWPSTLVGDGAAVAAGARVAGSVVGAGARIEPGALVEGSLLLPGVRVAAGAWVQDSIVGRGSLVGEKARLADLTVVGDDAEVAPGEHLVTARRPEA